MNKVQHWYFVVIEKGKEVIGSYGDSTRYTQEEAFNKMKIKYPDCRIATEDDMDRLL
jgi:hypothetical protein